MITAQLRAQSRWPLTRAASDDFTRNMLRAVNGMMLDMLASIACKDYEDRRQRQKEGGEKPDWKQADQAKHELIRMLRLQNGKSINETARLAGVSRMTVNGSG